MLSPIRTPGYLRPGWSDFGAYRAGGSHDGLDLYAPRGTQLWLPAGAVVTRKGYHAAGHGHYVAAQVGDVEVSYSHMIAASPLHIGQKLRDPAIAGGVGATGNAAGNDWPADQSPTAITLQHVHIETRVGGVLVDPADYLTASPTPSQEDEMRLIKRSEGSPEWSLFHPSLRGADDKQLGYIATTDEATARGWARTWGEGFGREKAEPRSVYVEEQAAARVAHAAYQRGLPNPSAAASVDVAAIVREVLDALHKRLAS